MTGGSLFISGMQRSGTTLLARLLDAQAQVRIFSQPFPLLFSEVKRSFLGDDSRYPLGHLFLENRYRPADLARFLADWRPRPQDLRQLFRAMDTFSGQYTRFDLDVRENAIGRLSDESFARTVEFLNRELQPADTPWTGSKETICEEFVPALLESGIRCILIVRDPRDVLASLNHGRGMSFAGAIKPTLWNLRHWRKSVAFCARYQDHPHFRFCRYEDLVASPGDTLERTWTFPGLVPVRIPSTLTNEDGKVWLGNSSYGEYQHISRSSAGVHRKVLSDNVGTFVEAACLPEMRFLGYETSLSNARAAEVLRAFADPFPSPREELASDTTSPAALEIEVERLERARLPAGDDCEGWFLFRETHSLLREHAIA